MLVKTVRELGLEPSDLGVELGDDRHQSGHGAAHRCRDDIGAANRAEGRAAWTSAARSSTRRWRPPRRSAKAIMDLDGFRPRVGVGAKPGTAGVDAVEVIEAVQGTGIGRRVERNWLVWRWGQIRL